MAGGVRQAHSVSGPIPTRPAASASGPPHPFPETFLEAGSLWEHLSRGHISFRNYGEGLEVAGYERRSWQPAHGSSRGGEHADAGSVV